MPIHDPGLLDALEQMTAAPWSGTVWRHMVNDYRPERVNTSGARWNPPGVGAIYTSLSSETALAEAEHGLSAQPRRPQPRRRTLYRIDVGIDRLIDLSTESALDLVGLVLGDVSADSHSACQQVGGAAAWLGLDGLLVPSARHAGLNIVVLVDSGGGLPRFDVTGEQDIQ